MIAFGIAALLHLYLWKRLARDTLASKGRQRTGAMVITAALVVLLATASLGDRLPSGLRWLTLPGYVWLAVMSTCS